MANTKPPRQRSPEIERARERLQQPVVDRQEVLALIKELKAERAFGSKFLFHALNHSSYPLHRTNEIFPDGFSGYSSHMSKFFFA